MSTALLRRPAQVIDRKLDTDNLGTVSGSFAVDFDQGAYDNKEVACSTDISPTFAGTRKTQYGFDVKATGAPQITWPANVKWDGGDSPGLIPNDTTSFVFKFDGMNFIGIRS